MDVMSSTFRVLFVCLGNICRSPMGERLLAARLPKDRFEVSSAGLTALAGQGMNPPAAALLRAHGGDPEGFVARDLTTQMVVESDLILTATKDIRSRVLSDAPMALRRTFTVIEFAALLDLVPPGSPRELVAAAAADRSAAHLGDYDIPDPYRRDDATYQLASTLMYDACERIAKALDG